MLARAEVPGGVTLGDRLRLAIGAQKAGDARGVLHKVIDIIVQRQLGQHVAWHRLALDLYLFAALDLGHVLARHFHRLDQSRQAQPFSFGEDCFLHLVFKAGIGVNDVPTGHVCLLILSEIVADQASESRNCTILPKIVSMPRKNSANITINSPTKIAV